MQPPEHELMNFLWRGERMGLGEVLAQTGKTLIVTVVQKVLSPITPGHTDSHMVWTVVTGDVNPLPQAIPTAGYPEHSTRETVTVGSEEGAPGVCRFHHHLNRM